VLVSFGARPHPDEPRGVQDAVVDRVSQLVGREHAGGH
jgi:hypothetical protein